MARIGWPSELRGGLGWLSSRRSVLQVIRTTRELLPGDPSFGDPMSTTGSEPARVLARRAWSAGDGRWGAISELGLAVLQVADWVGGELRPGYGDTPHGSRFIGRRRLPRWGVHRGGHVR